MSGSKTVSRNQSSLSSNKRDFDDTDFRNLKSFYETRDDNCTFCNGLKNIPTVIYSSSNTSPTIVTLDGIVVCTVPARGNRMRGNRMAL